LVVLVPVDTVPPDSELLDLNLGLDPAEEVYIRLSIFLLLKIDVDPFGKIFDNLLFGRVEFEVVTGKLGDMAA
jgi:hypothetical protein